MPIIKQMHQNLANMIAAGEVVNRPASVLKELVENAIDAQAKTITIEIKDMGMSYLSVADDGVGMDASDLKMAFLRHATSKITTEADLSHIQTLGFRGEALAAIASVSKVTMLSKQKHQDGHMIKVEGGNIKDIGLTSMSDGTKVIVEDLFYNTPARFKYIKSDIAEKAALIDIFDRLALSHPYIQFKLFMDDALIKHTFGQKDIYALIDQIYGKKMTEDLILFEDEIQKIKVRAYLVSPKITRSRKKDISVFINGRYIKNYMLTQAVIEGYETYIMINRYPIALIYLEMDPSLIDVNVHPQKFEVKLVNESLLSYQLKERIHQRLKGHTHTITKAEPNQLDRNYQKDHIHIQSFDDFLNEDRLEYTAQQMDLNHVESKIPEFDYVGTFAGTYLLFQNEDGLFLMDQHAAQERIRYQYYHEALKHPKRIKKHLLIAHTLSITHEDLKVIAQNTTYFSSYGFDFNEAFQLISIPMWLKDDHIDLAIETMISYLDQEKPFDLSVLRDHLAKDISCKGSIKANQSISLPEIKALVKDLKSCDNPYTCPHGRPTLIKISHYDIEKLFKRVVS